jgi:hypothetical protein
MYQDDDRSGSIGVTEFERFTRLCLTEKDAEEREAAEECSHEDASVDNFGIGNPMTAKNPMTTLVGGDGMTKVEMRV